MLGQNLTTLTLDQRMLHNCQEELKQARDEIHRIRTALQLSTNGLRHCSKTRNLQMRIELSKTGKIKTVHAGHALCGIRISSVTFTAEDAEEIAKNVSKDKFAEWFYNSVLTRFAPRVYGPNVQIEGQQCFLNRLN